MAARDYYTTKEVAVMYECSRQTAVRNGAAGKIPGMFRWLGRYRFDKGAVDRHRAELDAAKRPQRPKRPKTPKVS